MDTEHMAVGHSAKAALQESSNGEGSTRENHQLLTVPGKTLSQNG